MASPPGFETGTIIDGKYEVIKRLGAGGMGEVYQVRHIHLLDIRVIKVMRAGIAQSDTEIRRFITEARLATQIQNPYVATLHDFAQLQDNSFYMVWEYIPGRDLYQILKTCGPMPLHLVKTISRQILQGLQALHEAGIIHRDISPENIMCYLSPQGDLRAKLIDLGIARSLQSDERLTQTGVFMGKLKYCSPEQVGFLEEGKEVDHRTDIYSFGVVLYEMVSGAAPFSSTTPYGYIHKHIKEPPPPLQLAFSGETNQRINQVILKALEKDREKRYSSAQALLKALESLPEVPHEADLLTYLAPIPKETLQGETSHGEPSDALSWTPTQPKLPAEMEETPTRVVESGKGKKKTGSKKLMWIGATFILVLAFFFYYLQVIRKTPPPEPPAPVRFGKVQVIITPWAELLDLKEIPSGKTLPLPSKITPMLLSLPQGSYSITYRIQGQGEPLTQSFVVEPDKTTRFIDRNPVDAQAFLEKIH